MQFIIKSVIFGASVVMLYFLAGGYQGSVHQAITDRQFYSPFTDPLTAEKDNAGETNNTGTGIKKSYGKTTVCYADLSYGYIGTTDKKPADNPFDNIFHIRVPHIPSNNAAVYLSYELYGVTNHLSVARSINESQAVGGHFVTLKNAWSAQKDVIPVSILHEGDNVVRFSLPANAAYHYEVRKLAIHFEEQPVSKPAIILNQADSSYYDNQVYVKGIITLPAKYANAANSIVQLTCGEQVIPVYNGEFEAVLPNLLNNPFKSSLKAILPDGEMITREIVFIKHQTADQVYLHEEKGWRNAGLYIPSQGLSLSLARNKTVTSVQIPAQAVSLNKRISITALRDIDLPAHDPDMVNVTAGSPGYRFLPHGSQFKKNVQLSIPFDSTLIPDGYTAADIRTYYFDEQARKWMELPMDSVIVHAGVVLSHTLHFTDMINGIIKVPESPATNGYTPTSIKDFKPANPSEGIVIIQPPVSNSRGNASFSFGLKLPAGRQGMEPELSLHYSNDEGNGWMGMGWNLSIPFITVDSRWGVPHYDPSLETETYSLSGEQLAPTANRGALVKRSSEKQFYPRVEGSFDKIIRHGTSPDKYWWEVVNKKGVRSFYGGLPGKNVVDSAVLKDGRGNISYWALVQTKDPDDNCEHYLYDIVKDPGVTGNNITNGQQLYIGKIFYTGTSAQDGPYSIVFTRDRQLGEPRRKDVMIDCRMGFKMVTADLLRTITINLNGQVIRSYELKYQQGAFYKTLLNSISELDDAGNIFYTHSLDYYDDVNSPAGFVPLGEVKKWSVPNDNISGGIVNPIPGFTGQNSALSTEKTNSIGGGLALTIGLMEDVWSKEGTVGGSFEFDHSSNEGLVSMIDINGDGLPDKVMKKDNKLFYRANLGVAAMFGDLKPITGVNDFSAGVALTFSGGIQIMPGGMSFFGYNHASTTSRTNVFFSDFNGDGLMDIASNGQVFFNHINANGDPEFDIASTRTPNPLFLGGPVDKSFFAPDTALQRKQESEFPLQDIVRFWTAPFDGTISINGPLHLIRVADSLRSKKEDGVRASIQLRGGIIWSTLIPAGDFTIKTPAGVNALAVKKGDRVYFRLQSIYNGENDEVNWDPAIDYITPVSPAVDANNKISSHYRASEDFIISGIQPLGIAKTGAIKIFGDFTKGITSDTVELQVISTNKLGTSKEVFKKIFPGNVTSTGAPDTIVFNVTKDDVLNFKVHADSYIDRTAVQWLPNYELVFIDTVTNNPVSLKGSIVPENNNYNTWLIPTTVLQKSARDSLIIYPDISGSADTSGVLVFTLKGPDTIYAKRLIQLDKGKIVNHPDSIPIILPAGVPIFPEYHTEGKKFALKLQIPGIISRKDTIVLVRDTSVHDSAVYNTVHQVLLDTLRAGLYTNSNKDSLSAEFRGWGQFSFAGNKGDGPLDQAKLNYGEVDTVSVNYRSILQDTARYRQDTASLKNVPNPSRSDFVSLYGNGQKKSWVGRDSSVFVSANTMSSARLFMHDVSVDSLMLSTGASLSAVSKIEQSEVNSISLGVVLDFGYSDASNVTMLDMMDINGDEYPDIIHINDVQYTLPNGGLEQKGRTNLLGSVNSNGTSLGLSLGGVFPRASANNNNHSGSPNAHNSKTKNGARNEHNNANSSIGVAFSGGINNNDDVSNSSWIDMNGDGLPDRVYKNGTVALNLGYTFTDPENWNFQDIEKNNTLSFNAGLGVNIYESTLQAGVGISRSESNTNTALLDINGDGLPDKLTTSGALMVQLNTGNGFAAPVAWKGASSINKTLSTGESVNVAFTIPIDIFIIGLKICINPSFNIGHAVSGQNDQVLDIDGDGFPDLVYSSGDGDLSVRKSLIGRTNMLRRVQCPMGSSFTVDYEQLGSTYDMPQTVWVMKDLEVFDGVKGDGADTMRTSFTYKGGHYNRREREFYGFDTVITKQLNTVSNNAVYRSTEELFLNDNYYVKGLLKTESLRDAAGNIFTQTKNSYELRNVADSVVFPALVQTDKLFYEGNAVAGASTFMHYDYDTLGNIIKISDIGDGSQQDLQIAVVTYHDNDPLYIKDVPSSIEVTTVEGVKRKRTTNIDDKGHVIQINQFLADGTSAKYNLEYDTYGNMVKMLRPANYKGERMFYSYQYDNVIHNRIIKTTDAYGYTDSTAYEFRFGNVISTTSMQNEQVHIGIDNRGRIISVTGPYELAAGRPYTIAFEYHPEANVPYAITHHYDPEYSDDINTITFMDGLGRPLQVKKQVSIFKGKNADDDLKMIVSGRVIYDAFGRVVKSYFPTTEALGTANINFSMVFGNINDITSYDVEDRVRSKKLADGATDSVVYNAVSNLLITQMTDALGNKMEKYDDVKGRQKIVKQFGGPDGTITTSYFYDALNELLRVEDNNKNKIVSTYDNFGRRLSVLHPDAGLTELNYDLAGNLLQKITPQIRKLVPNGGAIKYQYDHERIIDVDYPVQYQNKVSYAYGAPGSGDRAGRLILQKDASGGREFYYGKLGEITKEIRTVLVNTVFYTTYVSEQEFDTWNRIKKMTYPDGEAVTYQYNRSGGLLSIAGQKLGNSYYYVSQLGYDEFEDRVYLRYGNGTETHYAFDSLRRRLQLLQSSTASGRLMMNNRYSYDAVNNITGIINNTTAQQGKLGGHASQKYTYDNLYRLTNASGHYEGFKDTATYGLEMGYDNLNNIISKKLSNKAPPGNYQHTYSYGNAGPHQATQIGDKNCKYDLNGNLTVYGNTEYFWDEENRLMAVVDSGALNEYTYDAGGERVIKSSGGMQGTWLNGAPAGTINHFDNYTVYVSPYLVCRRTSFTKHIFIGSERVATKIGEGSFANISFPQSALTAGGVDYIKRAKQLQQDRISYYASLGISPGPPTNKLFYAEPQNTGIAAPVLVDSTAGNVPPGWPGDTTRPANGGPPIYVSPIPTNDSVKAGYGFRGTGHIYESNQYFYHADHIGSTAYVSNVVGEVGQHEEYVAFGETFFDEHSSTVSTPYLFNAKELDAETGLYYYGARYYNASTSGWLSVDPFAEDYPNTSPYAYVLNNPIAYFDPDGRVVVNVHLSRLPKGMEEYSDLAEEAMSYRLDPSGPGVEKSYNIAVFEFEKGGQIFTITAHSGEGHGHSERAAFEEAKSQGLVTYEPEGKKHTYRLAKGVTLPRIYTDRDACVSCSDLIERSVGKKVTKNETLVISAVSYGNRNDQESGGRTAVLRENRVAQGGFKDIGSFKDIIIREERLRRGIRRDAPPAIVQPETKRARVVPSKPKKQ